jgi:hypothetical protein
MKMPKKLRNSRYGVYECDITEGLITKGRYITGDYIGVFTWDDLITEIIPDIREAKQAGWVFEYPVLVASWRLQTSGPPNPLSTPVGEGKLTISRAGLQNVKRMLGLPLRRHKDPRTETWEAVVDASDRAIKVVGRQVAQ